MKFLKYFAVLASVAVLSGCFLNKDEPSSPDEIDFSKLAWDYGGLNASNAELVDGATIGSLNVSSSGMSYQWVSGGCENLDASNSHDNANCVAAFFVKDSSGSWRGGKIDWISTDRLTRDFKNIKSGYNGWKRDAVETATGYAFVIVTQDGSKRTNVIVKE